MQGSRASSSRNAPRGDARTQDPTRHDDPRGDHDDDGRAGAGITAVVLGIIGIIGILAAIAAMAGFMPLILDLIGLVLGIAGLAVAFAARSRRRPDAPKAKGSLLGGLVSSLVACSRRPAAAGGPAVRRE